MSEGIGGNDYRVLTIYPHEELIRRHDTVYITFALIIFYSLRHPGYALLDKVNFLFVTLTLLKRYGCLQ